MPRIPGIPSYRRKGRYAVVTLPTPDGRRDVMLGRYGSETSREAYTRVLQEWQAGGNLKGSRRIVVGITVGELTLDYFAAFERTANRAACSSLKAATRVLNLHCAAKPAATIGPNMLREVRESMIAGNKDLKPPRPPWSRVYCNRQVRAIVAMFRWAAAHELVPSTVYETLRTIEPLKPGQTEAKEYAPVTCAPQADVEAVRALANKRVQAMIDLQLITGMRPGEVCRMRLSEIDRTKPAWCYRPRQHKTAHRGKSRAVYLGPRCQRVLMPFLDTKPSVPIFGYTVLGYYCVVRRLCDRAKIKRWHPNQLRHSAGTAFRRDHGELVASTMLGHDYPETTKIYAQRDEALMEQIATKHG